ncbi:hypothetical protein MUY14_26570 [Amycolatopsis sp. FBCC-B4732]|uniref:hypothetical protein n=1 Tax=Amycolatopsis sp. FBCC-B4732 TaxID=3079339 RepID=UPI001FF56161|nr:hypothetical protein [Amycolatopsis sp. FBCC-B4732]UOX85349.1 hypothetical protein MUY14_26570 [Amycolatopsis sp. FBCC-B4732]
MTDGQLKSVDIQIAAEDLETLKHNGYRLCFAKKVNDTYNVVWQSAAKYLGDNTFTWQPLYELFGSNEFKDSVGVRVSTNQVPIGLGDQAVLDSAGVLGDASSGGSATGITLVNDYGTIHPGLCAFSTDIHGNPSTSPIYVAADAIVPGTDVLTPVECVQVWFEQDIATSTMFSSARSDAVEIDLTEEDSAVRLYSGGAWSTPPSISVDTKAIVTIIAALTVSVGVQQLLAKITSKLTGVYQDIQVDVKVAGGNTVSLVYSEKPGLSPVRLELTRMLLQNATTVDQLTAFAIEAFAQLKAGYVSLTATAAA